MGMCRSGDVEVWGCGGLEVQKYNDQRSGTAMVNPNFHFKVFVSPNKIFT